MLEFTGKIGKAEGSLDFAITRELTPEDIIVRQACVVGSKPPGIKSLRATHHKLAQCLASGMSDAEASVATGYSGSRISILKGDPAFQELLAFYAGTRNDVFVDVQQRMAGFATNVLEVLQEKLDDSPESFAIKDLNNLLKTTADRGGYSPVQKTENRTVVINAAEIARIKAEVEAKQNGQIRKINQEEESKRVAEFSKRETGSILPGDSGPVQSSNDNGPTSDIDQQT